MPDSSIETIVKARGIKRLLHFTRVENLEGILSHGLVPKTSFETYRLAPIINDELRLDNCPNAVSLSITFPNYRMFYRYRCENPQASWAVIGIHPSVLWNRDCAFCVENAASANVTAISVDGRKGSQAFENLFAEFDGKPRRQQLGLTDAHTTNPQAEVLVFERIEPQLIFGIGFNDAALADYYRQASPGRQVICARHLFGYRSDYEYWR